MSRLLRVDRPVRIARGAAGWGWSCWLCPLPLGELVTTCGSWRQAIDDADEHARTCHRREQHVLAWRAEAGLAPVIPLPTTPACAADSAESVESVEGRAA